MVTEEMRKYISSLTRADLEAMLLRVLSEQMSQATKLCIELANMGELLKK